MSQYGEILSHKRLRESEVADRNILLEAESDRGRLLYCPAFRRLQQKAQVFSMEPNAAVRSRLTHSLEVSQIGRYISDKISLNLSEQNIANKEQCAALTTFVETACLMHDIGNPPFGHFGEAAIAEWFSKNYEDVIRKACNISDADFENYNVAENVSDFLEFDGNPQGLRVVTKLQRKSDEFGLNLTVTTIASYIKYIRKSGKKIDGGKLFQKKCGYFTTEKDVVEEVWKELKLQPPQRFCLAYIMEAADDIAYCVSDLEDSIEKGLLNKRVAFEDILKNWKEENENSDELSEKISLHLERLVESEKNNDAKFTFTDFRTSLNRDLVDFCSSAYIEKHEAVLEGTLPSLILPNSSAEKILEIIKSYCRSKVYCHETVQRVELAGFKAITGLLDIFECLLVCSYERFECCLDYSNSKDKDGIPIVVERKLLAIFPKNYIAAYNDALNKLDKKSTSFYIKEWNLRAHLVVDYLSGMTDDFATSSFQNLSGMKL